MSKKKESLNKKDLNQVAGGGPGASKPIKLPTRGKPIGKELLVQYQAYFGKEMMQGRTPKQFKDWLKLRG